MMKKMISLFLSFVVVFGVFANVPVSVNAASVDDLTFELNDDGESYSVVNCTMSAEGEMVIPDTHNGLPVTAMAGYCFDDCKSLKSVIIPEGVLEIGGFYGCDNLVSVSIPSTATKIYANAFCGCVNLEKITIPEKVSFIGPWAFQECRKLKEINIPDGVEKISKYTFIFCESLSTVKIPNSVKNIDTGAFFECTSLKSITIPDSVTSIGADAFNSCTSLTSVKIPDSVTDIGSCAFGYYKDWGASTSDYVKIQNFIIFGVKNSQAETYAQENGFTFIEIKKPTAPSLKKVSNVDGYVKVSWGAVEGADLYRVYRMVSGGEYEYIGSSTNTSYTDKKAPAGKTCRYKIKAKNDAGYSELSASIAIKHIDEPALKSIENSAYGVLIKWGKVTGAEKYNVYRKVSGGDYEYIGVTENAYYTDKTAESGTKYYYAIRGKRDDSVSSQSASLSKYYLADPTLNTPSSSSKGIGLRWSQVEGAEGYMVYRRTADGSYKRITTEEGVSNVTFRDTTAKKGTKYYYKVKAYKSKTYSAYSNTKAITDKY